MRKALQPFWFGIVLAAGIAIGIWLVPYKVAGGRKLSQVLTLIGSNYVDTVNTDELEQKAVNQLLHDLDPHSVYFTAEEARQANEPLEGSFEGIGIEFLLLNDTILVTNVVDDGPSAKAGIHTGDKIVGVNKELLAGRHLKNEDVIKLLKGPRGTDVEIAIYRQDETRNLQFNITRGNIPIKSVEAFYMADPETGYIKLSRFAATSYDEYMSAFKSLLNSGMKNLIIDLRDNGGGYLHTAQQIADEFLEDNRKILTTKGEHSGSESFVATRKGSFESGKLVVLVNENSASASEILSGALQDNDRALIVGRRTFGKGLVQKPFELSDGSTIRLTISRYYTPSGRSIQRPYTSGYEAYEDDYHRRYKTGELFYSDSIKNSGEIYKTIGGRTVYGGGGIVPDIFVPLDTTENSALFEDLVSKSILRQASFNYARRQMEKLTKFKGLENFDKEFEVPGELIEETKRLASANRISGTEAEYRQADKTIKTYLKAGIAKQLYGNNGFYYVLNSGDQTFKKALASFMDKSSFRVIKQ
jgi:carboxyl-terminal processing protease